MSISSQSTHFRTINYLGSKLRILDFLTEKFNALRKPNEIFCDLFAGSGCVSYTMSKFCPVVSCDIQKYSEIICHAMMDNFNVSSEELAAIDDLISTYTSSPLFDSFEPLISLEENAINTLDKGVLTDIIENGSIEVYSIDGGNSPISQQLYKASHKLASHCLLGIESLLSRYYGGSYFSYRQAVCMDILQIGIEKHINPENRNLFKAALLSTASDIVGTVGKHFAQPLKARDSKGGIKNIVISKALKDKTIDVPTTYREWIKRYICIPKTEYSHQFVNGDFSDCLRVLPENTGIVYADPPYTRDHYSRFYHVLETIALGDTPKLSTVKSKGNCHISNGIYRTDRFQSPFCIKTKAPLAFSNLFHMTAAIDSKLILSYSPYDTTKKSHPRVVTIDQLIKLANSYYTN